RTIYRDVDALSSAGVPVYTERGPKGGVALLEDYRTELTGLTEDEARALFTFAGPQLVADLGLDAKLEAALRKLMAALPESQRSGAQRARQRVLIDAAAWMRPAEPVPHLGIVQEASWADRRLRLRYRGGDQSSDRVVDPYGLVAKAGVWYLVGGADAHAAVDGWRRLRLMFPAAGAARAALLQFGELVEVLEPPELRQEMVEHALALVDLYADRQPAG